MAFFWADTFDLYSAPADAINGYWDSGTTSGFTLVAGRFSGSRAIQSASNNPWLVKSSGQNDALHHIVCAFQQTATLTGSGMYGYFQLSDGATNQVCIVFRQDGAIVLTSATPGGTALATYTGAVTATSTWYAFEIEVFISATAGYMNVRKNGNTSNDFASATNLNTRPGTNNYANKLTVGYNALNTAQIFDDLIWRSDASSVPWIGDVRGWARMPTSDASVQWTPSSTTTVPITPYTQTATATVAVATGMYTPFTASISGPLASAALVFTVASTANFKCALYTNNAGVPGTVIASANVVAAPGIGSAIFTFASPPSLVAGTQYFLAFDADATSGTLATQTAATVAYTRGDTYALFPVNNPGSLATGQAARIITANVTASPMNNAYMVMEPQQDAAASYVYSSTVGQSDRYGIAPISSTPSSVVAVVTRAYCQKSDAGTRNVAVQLQSGATNVQSASTALNTVWGWISRTDLTDPATGAAWTAVGVNNAQVGVVVTA